MMRAVDRYMLNARGIDKSYYAGGKKINAVKGADISVKQGEFVLIAGPSGAGKSTLLHVLASLDRPDRGKVILEGVDIYGLPDKKRAAIRNRKIGFVFQFYHLLPEFSALENVMLPGMIAGGDIRKLRPKAEGLMSRVGLSGRTGHLPSELSGGEQQRVAIARALINSPEILFCDEPTGNLDSRSGGSVYELILDLNKTGGVTLVVVTHQKDFYGAPARRLEIKDGILTQGMV